MANFTIYKSSAGSGKTFTLVKEYLKIALKTDNPSSYKGILAITFTNKAAAEMKERVVDALKEITNSSTSFLRDIIVEELQIPNHELQERAQATLTHLLHNYSGFSISTIDKFVHQIVRTFAFDLHLPITFEVELDSNAIINTATNTLLQTVGENKELTNLLIQFIETQTDDEKSWHIENEISSLGKNLLKEEEYNYVNKLKHLSIKDFITIKKALKEHKTTFETDIKSIGKKGLDLIGDNGISKSSFASGANGIPKYFEYLSKVTKDKLSPSAKVQAIFDGGKWISGKCPSEDEQKIESIKSELTNFHNAAVDLIENHYPTYLLYTEVEKVIYGISVLNELEKTIQTIKKEQNLIHISEFNRYISKIVMNEPTPFIYERLGERYRHYLIDEFQDTSELQWQNIVPLVENSLATGNTSFIVGDGKQSIYRWRGGKVEQFSQLPYLGEQPKLDPLLKQREETLVRNHSIENLGTNYRSKRNIVEFNNWLFESLKNHLIPEHQIIYEKQSQEVKPGNEDGTVCVEILSKKDDLEQKHQDKTLEYIQNCIQSGYKFGDIAVLFRSNKEAIKVANYLAENDIPIVSSETLLLSTNSKVKLLVAALKHIAQPSDISLKAALLFKLGITNHIELGNAISSSSVFKNTINTIAPTFNESELRQLPLYEMVEQLVSIFNLSNSNNPFILAFLDFVYASDSKNNLSLPSLLELWEQKMEKLAISVPEGANAVNIVTIHKAKGLQFPVVILPFANWKTVLSTHSIWVEKTKENQLPIPASLIGYSKRLENTAVANNYYKEQSEIMLDNLNVFYVATTRAEEQLYIISDDSSSRDFSKTYIPTITQHKLWNEDTQSLVIGESIKKTQKAKESEGFELAASDFPSWRNRIALGLTASNVWETELPQEPAAYGNIVHYALSKIDYLLDLNNAIDQLETEGVVTKDGGGKLKKELSELLDNPTIKPFFTNKYKVKNEAEILTKDGKIMRPDRLLFNDSETIIIDFKTGAKNDSHQEQVLQYVNAIEQMGHTSVKSYLLYTNSCELVEV